MRNYRYRMTFKQQLAVIDWIKASKTEAEINEMAGQFDPPFYVDHRKYTRYRLVYDPARAIALLAEVKRAQDNLAKLQAYQPDDEEAPTQETPPPGRPAAEAYMSTPTPAKTIKDYYRDIFELDGPQRGSRSSRVPFR